MPTVATKIPAVKVRFQQAEGLFRDIRRVIEVEGPNCMAEASSLIFQRILETCDRDMLGYLKCDFWVTFADGETYKGNMLMVHPDAKGYNRRECNVAAHMRDFLEFHAGERRPSHMSVESYETFMLQQGQELQASAKAYLETYEI